MLNIELELTELGRDHFRNVILTLKNSYLKSNPDGVNAPKTLGDKDFVCRVVVEENDVMVVYNYSLNFGDTLEIPQAHYDACPCLAGFVDKKYLKIK